MSTGKVFFGESQCQARQSSSGRPCTNKAYYSQGSKYVCGVHSQANRNKLPKNPNADQAKQDKLDKHQEAVDAVQEENKKNGRAGAVICTKLRMMKSAEDHHGFLKVFPNFKHQNRKDGFGCAKLSPKCLGPVSHGQRKLPPAKSLENYHQFNKVFASEVDRNEKPTKEFYELRVKGYQDSVAHRHKKSSKAQTKEDKRVLYSLHENREGKRMKYDYVESRYFYCHFYEILAREQPDFQRLQEMVRDGVNLQLVGYDGYEVTKDLMHHYLDTRRPFGHELALYTMLTIDGCRNYPWNQYYEKHQDLYPARLCPPYMEAEDTPAEEQTATDMEAK